MAVEKTIADAIIETFETMLSLKLTEVDTQSDPGLHKKHLVASINFAGAVVGILRVHVSEAFARLMAAAMLGIEASEIEGPEEIKVVLVEVADIVSEYLKRDFLAMNLACASSVPFIACGSDLTMEPDGIGPVHRWVFRHQKHELLIEIILQKEVREQVVERSMSGVAADAAEELRKEAPSDELHNLDLLLEIPLEVTVELGRTRKRLYEVAKMGPGSVIELAQLDGEPVDLLVNDTLVAKGEVLVERGKYCIRIVEVVSRKERFKSLG